jgi:uncharacterized membrane protein YeaQ/YmgE (transglycosylase-associated protein family)
MGDLLFYLIFGLIAGGIANYIDPRPAKGGILGSIVLGIIGAVVGGYLGSMLFGVGVTGFNISSFLVAVLGSLLVLWVGRMVMRDRVV